jgi:putative nucleotidyltransferase with HDIG domain
MVVEQAIDQLGVDAADVMTYDEATGTLELVAGKGFASPAALLAGPDWGGLVHRVIQAGCPLHISDLAYAPIVDARVSRLLTEGLVAYHALPLVAEGRVRGVLECFHRVAMEPDLEWLSFAAMLGGQAAIAIDNAALFEGLRRSHEELQAAYDATIEGWARALDLRDHETEGHSRRVTEMAMHLARAMGLGETDLVHIRRGALLHDIGKMGVPDSILHKPGPLTEEEWAVIRRHPSYAVEILEPSEFLGAALDIPHYHHERWDGTGYPCGLAEEQIPLAARIFAAVDIWDALNNDRPYRRAWPQERVRAHLRTLAGNHLDPRVVEVFLSLLARANLATNGSPGPSREPACAHEAGTTRRERDRDAQVDLSVGTDPVRSLPVASRSIAPKARVQSDLLSRRTAYAHECGVRPGPSQAIPLSR